MIALVSVIFIVFVVVVVIVDDGGAVQNTIINLNEIALAYDFAREIDKTRWKKRKMEKGNVPRQCATHLESLAIETRARSPFDPAESVTQKISFRTLAPFTRDRKKILVPSSSLRTADADSRH